MRRLAKVLAGAAMALSMTVMGGAAQAQEVCAGTQQIFAVCVDVTGGTLYEDCVYLVLPPCMPVSVPGPVITRCGNDVMTCSL
ncbi:MAG TPA: hypothetical protein VG318_11870 [Actinomycetota bacterium]|nr:hypothetical protein [Actinomycetota bacterium]